MATSNAGPINAGPANRVGHECGTRIRRCLNHPKYVLVYARLARKFYMHSPGLTYDPMRDERNTVMLFDSIAEAINWLEERVANERRPIR